MPHRGPCWLLGGGLCLAAAAAGGPAAAGGRVRLLTMTNPSDRLPLELVLPHQLRMLGEAVIQEVVVLVNQPPAWVAKGGLQDSFLRRLQASGAASVRRVDYATFDEPAFLQRFFRLRPSRQFPDPDRVSVRSLAAVGGMKMATNLLGMLHFLHHCLADGNATELCVWLDSDIFLHRSGGQGLADLAAGVFAARPDVVVLQPPSLCEPRERADGSGVCRAAEARVATSRHLVASPSRLARLLPFAVGVNDFRLPHAGLFEDALGAGLRRARGLWAMECGGEVAAVHPPHNRYELDFDEHLAALAAAGPEPTPLRGGFPGAWVAGAEALIERIEGGRFCRFSDYCTNMRPSAARIAQGLAW